MLRLGVAQATPHTRVEGYTNPAICSLMSIPDENVTGLQSYKKAVKG
jgi:hypothetical protein